MVQHNHLDVGDDVWFFVNDFHSCILLSDDHFASVLDVDAFGGGLATHLAAVERVPRGLRIPTEGVVLAVGNKRGSVFDVVPREVEASGSF